MKKSTRKTTILIIDAKNHRMTSMTFLWQKTRLFSTITATMIIIFRDQNYFLLWKYFLLNCQPRIVLRSLSLCKIVFPVQNTSWMWTLSSRSYKSLGKMCLLLSQFLLYWWGCFIWRVHTCSHPHINLNGNLLKALLITNKWWPWSLLHQTLAWHELFGVSQGLSMM